MKSRVVEWTLKDLYQKRDQIQFPVYQRGLVWSDKMQVLLIDSILRGIDIPKLYLERKTDSKGEVEWDCIDGHQRIQTIVGYFDDNFVYKGEFSAYTGKTFGKLGETEKRTIEEYKLTIVEVTDIEEDEVRLLFQRLQLGTPLNSGEMLNAIISNLREFVIEMRDQPFIRNTGITERRLAKEQVCAQICNNSMYINKSGEYRSSKYEDLENLYRAYKDFDRNSTEAKGITSVIRRLDSIFGLEASLMTNRASIVSIYLLVEEMMMKGTLDGNESTMRAFYLEFLANLRSEAKKGIDATNRFLIAYQSRVIQAADSGSAVAERHKRLKQAFDYYMRYQKIISQEEIVMPRCGVCNKQLSTWMEVARHIIGVSDQEHIAYVESKGLNYPELLGLKNGKLGKGSLKPLVDLLEREAQESDKKSN